MWCHCRCPRRRPLFSFGIYRFSQNPPKKKKNSKKTKAKYKQWDDVLVEMLISFVVVLCPYDAFPITIITLIIPIFIYYVKRDVSKYFCWSEFCFRSKSHNIIAYERSIDKFHRSTHSANSHTNTCTHLLWNNNQNSLHWRRIAIPGRDYSN